MTPLDSRTAQRIGFPGALDLEATLFSGQAFRWSRGPGSTYLGFIDNRPVAVQRTTRGLVWRAAPDLLPERIIHYFRLDDSHDAALRSFPPDPSLRRACETFPGLRILRQDPWEALVGFMVSQNSNEAKIRSTLEKLCHLAGTPTSGPGDRPLRAFPTAAAIARLSLAELRSTGAGYRARYLQGVARLVVRGRLQPDRLPGMVYDDAFRTLLQVDGIGEKVADCILLYGCGHLQAFPTDVWVRRFIHETFIRARTRPTHERLRAFAWRRWGPCAGYAQHYLFHYRRTVGRLDASPA